MLKLFTLISALWFTMNLTAQERRRDETGASVLEYVVIGLGVLLMATAAVAVIKGAVESRTNKIN